MISLASHILESKATKFDPSKFRDEYEMALRKSVQQGRTTEAPAGSIRAVFSKAKKLPICWCSKFTKIARAMNLKDAKARGPATSLPLLGRADEVNRLFAALNESVLVRSGHGSS